MGFEAQRIKGPDGADLVVLAAADYDDLLTLAEEGGDVVAAQMALQRIRAGEGTMPAAVLAMILDDHLSPVVAWRRYRNLSQAELAARANVSQVCVSRIETGARAGSAKTLAKLADALGAPIWGLEP